MNNFFFKIINTFKIMKTDPRTEEQQQKLKILYLIIAGIISAYMLVITLIDFSEFNFVYTNIILTIMYLAAFLFTLLGNKKKVSFVITSMAMLYSFSYFFLFKYHDGVSALWIFMIPILAMYIEGFNIGFFTSLAYLVIIVGFNCVPVTRKIMYKNYDLIFVLRYYSIYIIDVLLSGFAIRQFFIVEKIHNNYTAILDDAVANERKRVTEASMKAILTANRMLEAKDKYTEKHSERVAYFSALIAERMGYSEEKIEDLKKIALLHDIGKIGISENILNKPSSLSNEEFAMIKRHTIIGAEILKDLTIIPDIAIGAKHHHESFDGSGYPDKLKGTDIPEIARIICVADSFDAMAYKRVYKKEYDINHIRGELKNTRKKQFDPKIANIFIKICEENNWFQNFDI